MHFFWGVNIGILVFWYISSHIFWSYNYGHMTYMEIISKKSCIHIILHITFCMISAQSPYVVKTFSEYCNCMVPSFNASTVALQNCCQEEVTRAARKDLDLEEPRPRRSRLRTPSANAVPWLGGFLSREVLPPNFTPGMPPWFLDGT